jgi:hypothetical protein
MAIRRAFLRRDGDTFVLFTFRAYPEGWGYQITILDSEQALALQADIVGALVSQLPEFDAKQQTEAAEAAKVHPLIPCANCPDNSGEHTNELGVVGCCFVPNCVCTRFEEKAQ